MKGLVKENYFKKNIFKEKVNDLYNDILNVPGEKNVTILNDKGNFRFVIDSSGNIGYKPLHISDFLLQLENCFISNGILILRQFTREMTNIKIKDNRIIRIPIKNLYVCRIINMKVNWIPGKDLKTVYNKNFKEEKYLLEESSVNFCDFNK